MNDRQIDILGLAETRLKGNEPGKELRQGHILIYKGIDEGRGIHGVAMIIGPKLSPYIQDVKLISPRLMRVTLQVKNKKYNIFQVYAPQQGRSEEEKEEFINSLEENYNENEDTKTIMMGDFNARVGNNRNGIQHDCNRPTWRSSSK